MEMDLNDGLFSQNCRCGYVLKPKFLRGWERFDPENPRGLEGYMPLRLSIQVRGTPRGLEGYMPLRLSIQIISGQQLPKVNIKEGSIIDPLVRVEIHGVPMDQAKQETKYIDNNGFNPVWYETLQFTVHVPELALVRFVVEDYDKTSKNDFVGQYTLPFMSIQQGKQPAGAASIQSDLFDHFPVYNSFWTGVVQSDTCNWMGTDGLNGLLSFITFLMSRPI
ncbi:1-phosphatidylinositol 4,5-bisphosphate phosphodiesterase delta-4 [Acipenser ruthenus]|uniref:1-phosphatidylinositol 4,5-bisphosphate phosphodiesterase delta-4 n=1 Tax=Acipenser ruthenus TaxID=7906 RepID=A0A444V659_ACIRT|nr:1-phosphatidylinositol 4,5-bisphosphate phosphodiesterase delta-4 [Acipenser ruthenus]